MFDSVKSFFTTKKDSPVPGEETEMDSDFLSEFDLDGSKALKEKNEDENVADVTKLLVALDRLFDKREKILREEISAQNNESLSEEEREAKIAEIDRRYIAVQSEARLLEEKIRPYESVLGNKFPDDRAIFALSNRLKVGYTERAEDDNQYQEPMSMENPGFSLSPLSEKKVLSPINPEGGYNFSPRTPSENLDKPLEFDVSPEEHAAMEQALANKIDVPVREATTRAAQHENAAAEAPSETWLAAEREGTGSGVRVVEAPMQVIDAGGAGEKLSESIVEEQLVSPEAISIDFDLVKMRETLVIKKKGYEYAKKKADDPENAPLKSEFQKEAKISMEEYRSSLNEARLKLAEMIKSSDGDAKKLLMQEFADVVKELGSLDQGETPEELPQEKAA